MLTNEKLNSAIIEAERFIEKAKLAQVRLANDDWAKYRCKEASAAKRASMDLTRSLTELRKI